MRSRTPYHSKLSGRAAPRRRSGYTLVEMIVGTLSFTILLAGLVSTLLIATTASDPNLGPPPSTVDASLTAEEMAAELGTLLAVTSKTNRHIEFTVADRDGDSNSEVLRYEWSGTAGDPLTRQYNGGTMQTLAENVHAFNLTYSGPPAPHDNLLQNPGFEIGTANWAIGAGNLDATVEVSYRGAASLKVTNRGSAADGPVQQVQNSLENGASYEFAAWVKTVSGSANFYIVLTTIDSVGTQNQYTGGQVSIDTDWTEVTASITPTWGGTLVTAEWSLRSSSGVGDFYADEAELRDINGSDRIYLQRINVDLQIGSDDKTAVSRPVEILNAPVVPAS